MTFIEFLESETSRKDGTTDESTQDRKYSTIVQQNLSHQPIEQDPSLTTNHNDNHRQNVNTNTSTTNETAKIFWICVLMFFFIGLFFRRFVFM